MACVHGLAPVVRRYSCLSVVRSARSLAIAACAMLFAATAAVAGVNSFTAVGPEGELVSQIVFHPTTPAIRYLAGQSGFYRSTDAGISWRLIRANDWQSRTRIAVDPSDGDRIFLSSVSDQLYSSTDGGLTVSRHTSYPPGQANVVEFSSDGSVVYAASGAAFHRSVDHGATWEARTPLPTATPGYAFDVLVDPADAATVVVQDVSAGMFVSTDAGDTWTPVVLPTVSLTSPLAFSRTGPQRLWVATLEGLFVSSDIGAHWSPTTVTDAVVSVITHPHDANVLYLGDLFGKLWRSDDQAVHWEDVTGEIRAGELYALAVSPSDPDHSMVGGVSVWGSSDGAATWTARSSGLTGGSIAGLSAAAASDRIYIGMASGGIHRLTGGDPPPEALDEEALAQPFTFPNRMGFGAILAQAVNPDRLLASAASNFVMRSVDAGVSWSVLDSAAFGGNGVFKFADSPVNEQLILASTVAGLYRSVNGGADWAPVAGLPAQAFVRDLAMNRTLAYAAVTTSGGVGAPVGHGVFKSEDGGATWAPANSGIDTVVVHTLAVDPSNDQIVYGGSVRGVIKTSNAGTTWNDVHWLNGPPVTANYLTAVDPLHPSIIYAAVGNHIGRSIDSGDTWEVLRSPQHQPQWTPSALLIDPQRSESLLVGTYSNGLQQMSVQPDLSVQVEGGSALIDQGGDVSLIYTLRNLGPFHATNARVVIQLPANVMDIAPTITGAVGSCSTTLTVLSCTFDALRAGFSAQIVVAFTAPAPGEFEVTASTAADQPDADSSNNAVNSMLSVVPVADMAVTLSGSAGAIEAEALRYTMSVTNSGPQTAASVRAILELPAGLTATSITPDQGSCTDSAGTIACTIASLESSAAATVVVDVAGPVPGTYQYTASVTSDGRDPNDSNNAASLTTIVSAATPPVPTPTPNPTPPPTPSTPAAGKGGGGSESLMMILACALVAWRSRARPARLA